MHSISARLRKQISTLSKTREPRDIPLARLVSARISSLILTQPFIFALIRELEVGTFGSRSAMRVASTCSILPVKVTVLQTNHTRVAGVVFLDPVILVINRGRAPGQDILFT
jgi:hypothetical protein